MNTIILLLSYLNSCVRIDLDNYSVHNSFFNALLEQHKPNKEQM